MAWLQQMPSGHYYICFRFGGRKFKRSLKTKSERTALSKKIRLDDLFEAFLAAVPEGNLEASSLKTMKTHRKHLERILGQTRYIASLAMSDLQTYVQKRTSGRRYFSMVPKSFLDRTETDREACC